MSLYNRIDAYAAHLQAAWVNIHHTSKGDQSGKSVTDVGSGAGSQSRAADTHVILRPHEDEGVSVIEAAVRSFPPVAPIAVRWDFPLWVLDSADPTKLKGLQGKDRVSQAERLEADRRAIVAAMVRLAAAETKTGIRDLSGVGHPRFGYAWASLLSDKTVVGGGTVKRNNGQTYDIFSLSQSKEGVS